MAPQRSAEFHKPIVRILFLSGLLSVPLCNLFFRAAILSGCLSAVCLSWWWWWWPTPGWARNLTLIRRWCPKVRLCHCPSQRVPNCLSSFTMSFLLSCRCFFFSLGRNLSIWARSRPIFLHCCLLRTFSFGFCLSLSLTCLLCLLLHLFGPGTGTRGCLSLCLACFCFPFRFRFFVGVRHGRGGQSQLLSSTPSVHTLIVTRSPPSNPACWCHRGRGSCWVLALLFPVRLHAFANMFPCCFICSRHSGGSADSTWACSCGQCAGRRGGISNPVLYVLECAQNFINSIFSLYYFDHIDHIWNCWLEMPNNVNNCVFVGVCVLQSFLFFIFVPCATLATHQIKKKTQSKNGMHFFQFHEHVFKEPRSNTLPQ